MSGDVVFGCRFVNGFISQVDVDKALAKVKFADFDDIETDWLPIPQANTEKNKDYILYDVGEHVRCMMDERFEDGAILHAIYDDTNPPPVKDKDKRHVKFEDGASFEYDRNNKSLRVENIDTLDLQSNKKITINAGDDVTVSTTKAAVINCNNAKIDAAEKIEFKTSSGAPKGVVQGECVCAFTGAPHPQISTTVSASK